MKKTMLIVAAAVLVAVGCTKEDEKKCWKCNFIFNDVTDTTQAQTKVDTSLCNMTNDEINSFRSTYESGYKKSKNIEHVSSTSACSEQK